MTYTALVLTDESHAKLVAAYKEAVPAGWKIYAHQKGIYAIINKVNSKLYVGSTQKSFKERFSAHLRLLKRNKHENPILQSAWNKYGENCFVFYVLVAKNDFAEEEILQLESETIDRLKSDSREFGYNICKVGKSRLGIKWSEASRQKRRGFGNPMFGKGHLRKGAKNPMWGKTLTKEHKEKMSRSLKGRKKPQSFVEKLSKPVFQCDKNGNVVAEFSSQKEAGIATGVNSSHISSACHGKRKSAGGYVWRFK